MSDPATWPIPDLHAPRGRLDDDQIDALLKAVAPYRVIHDEHFKATLPGQEIKAHLIRIFGFGGFDYYSHSELLYCDPRADSNGVPTGRYDAAAHGQVRLVIRNRNGELVQVIDESNVANSLNEPRHVAMQVAITSAITLALKRATVSLGDQFGLGLYNGGSMVPAVGDTLERRRKRQAADADGDGEPGDVDIQEAAPEQRVEEMTGVDPDSPAEVERMRAYAEARAAARNAGASTPAPAPAPALGEAAQCELLLAELTWWETLAPDMVGRVAARFGDVEPQSATAEQLASVILPMRHMIVIQLRRLGTDAAHAAADRYQSASGIGPLADLLGCEPDALG